MDYVYTFIGIYLDVILLIYLTNNFERIKNAACIYSVYSLYGLIVYCENLLGWPIYLKLLLNLFLILWGFSILYVNVSLFRKVKFIVLYFILLSIPEILITAIVFCISNYTVEELYNNTYLWFVCLMLSKTFTFFLIMILTKIKRLNKDKRENGILANIFEFIPLFITLGILIFDMYVIIYSDRYDENSVVFIIITITIALIIYTFSHIILFDIYDDLKYEERMVSFLEMRNGQQYDYYRQKLESEMEVRQIYHDMKNNILLLKKFRDSDEYIDNILATIYKLDNFVDTGNEMLDIILYEKIKVAQVNNIDFKIMADLSECNFLLDIEICNLYGNLIDNAIEACCKMDSKKERYIILKSKAVHNKFVVKIINSYEEPVTSHNGVLLTSKQNNKRHGIGISSVKSIVDAHQGEINIGYDGREFKVSILFYVK